MSSNKKFIYTFHSETMKYNNIHEWRAYIKKSKGKKYDQKAGAVELYRCCYINVFYNSFHSYVALFITVKYLKLNMKRAGTYPIVSYCEQ